VTLHKTTALAYFCPLRELVTTAFVSAEDRSCSLLLPLLSQVICYLTAISYYANPCTRKHFALPGDYL